MVTPTREKELQDLSGAHGRLNEKDSEKYSVDMSILKAIRDRKNDLLFNSGQIYDAIEKIFEKSHNFIVPSHDNPILSEFRKKAIDSAGNAEGVKLAEALNSFVYFHITSKDRREFFHARDERLESFIEKKEGVCKEKAAILQLIFQEKQMNSIFTAGTSTYVKKGLLGDKMDSGGHAWVTVTIGDKKYIADPTNTPSLLTDEILKTYQVTYTTENIFFFRSSLNMMVLNPSRLEEGDIMVTHLRVEPHASSQIPKTKQMLKKHLRI